jgi:hypothetical protein
VQFVVEFLMLYYKSIFIPKFGFFKPKQRNLSSNYSMKTKIIQQILLVILLIGIMMLNNTLHSQRITVEGTKFMIDGKEIWLNGANTPWHVWNDIGGKFDKEWYRNHFNEMHETGINCTRVWVTCDGEVGIHIDSAGFVSGMTETFWQDMDTLVKIAEESKIYLMCAMISFDHFQDSHHPNYQSWRNMIQSQEKIQAYLDNYVVPFVTRYKDNPYVSSIDICNEIIWLNENKACGNIAWDDIQRFVAMNAAAIHKNSPILVTLGDYTKYYSPLFNGNKYSDSALQANYNDPFAFLDFIKVHYYGWVGGWFENHFEKTPEYYQLDKKPCVIGEFSAKGAYTETRDGKTKTLVFTTTEAYEIAWKNGWNGAMAWTSSGVDDNGGLDLIGPATSAFRDKHFPLVFPLIKAECGTK